MTHTHTWSFFKAQSVMQRLIPTFSLARPACLVTSLAKLAVLISAIFPTCSKAEANQFSDKRTPTSTTTRTKLETRAKESAVRASSGCALQQLLRQRGCKGQQLCLRRRCRSQMRAARATAPSNMYLCVPPISDPKAPKNDVI